MPSLEGKSYDVVEAYPLCLGVCTGNQRQDRNLQYQTGEIRSQLEEANGS